MSATLLLDPSTWDLTVDVDGNIAVAKDPYALAQDVACACRTYQGELPYDTIQGIPYWQSILGKLPPLQFIKNAYVNAALTVPGVVAAVCFIESIEGRQVRGQVQTTDRNGVLNVTRF